MTGKPSIFNGPLEGWEAVESPAKGLDSSGRPTQAPDRVAREFTEIAKKYAAGKDISGSDGSDEHASLLRAKKKGSLDSDVNSKTFVLSGNKIVGSQG